MASGAQEVAEILDAVKDRVPALLRSLLDMIYTPEAAQKMGQAVGTFYKEMVAAGIPPERALELAENYLSPLKLLTEMIKN